MHRHVSLNPFKLFRLIYELLTSFKRFSEEIDMIRKRFQIDREIFFFSVYQQEIVVFF